MIREVRPAGESQQRLNRPPAQGLPMTIRAEQYPRLQTY